ncbi:hypothetical protein BGZ61DRAFT_537702 [Ilyonectria robusta]|uniref:uncharacterized protein n=1 Tax=Ilyonectria robusta TaxID=1079257 RepID=UPI001E8EA525|nr:uncharacterized protein BGZ61DRAFT_537702 [Ilyonectria robusta]KAH8669256.1 hypothetical protein BGZ61DRAFT_537702 [Ilyonectria robusta]
MEILDKTGGTPYRYFDEAAAARYRTWSTTATAGSHDFDDAKTFQMKIDYASKMGLHGPMISAIDLDTRNLEALRAIPKGEHNGDTRAPLSLVELEGFLPAEMLAPEVRSIPTRVLGTGDSHAVLSLKKREDEPEPLVFLDCLPNVLDQPKHETQTTRVVCLNKDVEGRFWVMERGVKGIIVEMPDNCAPNSLARAIS